MTLSTFIALALQRRRALVVSLLFMLVLSTASNADASCGDYVADHDEGTHATGWLGTTDLRLSQSEPAAPPCNGPHCRDSQPEAPLPTPVSPGRSLSERLLYSGRHGELDLVVGLVFFCTLDDAPFDGFASELLRPPSYAL